MSMADLTIGTIAHNLARLWYQDRRAEVIQQLSELSPLAAAAVALDMVRGVDSSAATLLREACIDGHAQRSDPGRTAHGPSSLQESHSAQPPSN
jgi:hypothetical protein